MTRLFLLFYLAFGLWAVGPLAGQTAPAHQICIDKSFDDKLGGLLKHTVSAIGPDHFSKIKDYAMVLDTRELEEYEVSHIPGALYGGYKNFDISKYNALPRDTLIIVYCSVGYRSEKVGEKFQKAGFKNVKNLYGSIFEWVNQGHPVVNTQSHETQKVHTYNRTWSKWVMDGKAEKVW